MSNNIWSKKVGLFKSDRKQDRTIYFYWSKDCFDNEKIRNSLSNFRPGHKSNLNFFDRVWFQGFHWEFLKHHWPSMRCVLNHDASFKIRFMSKSLRTIYLRQIELQSILMSSEHAMFVSNLVAQYIYIGQLDLSYALVLVNAWTTASGQSCSNNIMKIFKTDFFWKTLLVRISQ